MLHAAAVALHLGGPDTFVTAVQELIDADNPLLVGSKGVREVVAAMKRYTGEEGLSFADCFAGVLTYETLQAAGARLGTVAPGRVLCKPAPAAFLTALALAGGAAPSRALFLDDSPRNIAGAAAAGLAAVLVGSPVRCPGALAALQDVRELRAVVPQLWGEPAPKAAYEAAPVEELAVSG